MAKGGVTFAPPGAIIKGELMRRIDNPLLTHKIINHLADLYNIKQKREGIHLSSLVYCRTRAFLDYHQSIEPTDQEVMLFSLGYGLQDVLTPKDAEAPIFTKDGVTYSPDMLFSLNGEDNLVEIKTTRMSEKTLADSLPETWLEYIKGGCFIRAVNTYDLAVLLMMGNYHPPFPLLKCETLLFDDDELFDNWGEMLKRKAVLEEAISSNKPPYPFQNCQEWECKNCRYRMVCDAMVLSMAKGDEKLWNNT